MIAIKDIEMPICCYSCRFSKFPYDINKNPYCNKDPYCTPYCTIVFKELDLSRFDRPDWCPLIEVEPVKHAEWKEDGSWDWYVYKCSNCGHTERYDDMSYCPECGARMDE